MAPSDWHSLFFFVFAGLACAFALGVLFSSNIVRMAFYLVLSLGATAGLFFLAGADFVGAMQLVLYVGGTLVLLVFGVMLTAQGPFVSIKTAGGDWVIAALVAGTMLSILLPVAVQVGSPRHDQTAQHTDDHRHDHDHNGSSGEHQHKENAAAQPRPAPKPSQPTAARIGLAFLGVNTDIVVDSEGNRQNFTGYLLPFEIISIHLLIVLVGAAYLARAKRRVASSSADDASAGRTT